MSGQRTSRMLRWYPRVWRARYGEEMAALIEDFADGGKLSLKDHLDLIRVGLLMRRDARPAWPKLRRVRLITIRVASGVAALLLVLTLIFSAYRSQATTAVSSQAAVRNKTAIVVDVGGVVVTAAATMKIRRGQ